MANENSAMDAIKGLLGDNAEEKIQSVMNTLSSNPELQSNLGAAISGGGAQAGADESMEYILKMKGLIDEMSKRGNDPRANLLLSLKPYMRESRRKSIDGAVKILSLTKFSGLFGGFFGK